MKLFKKRDHLMSLYCQYAVRTVEYIKDQITDPRPSWVIDLVPSGIDFEMQVRIRSALIACIQNRILPGFDGKADKIRDFIYYLQSLSAPLRNAVYHKLASLLVRFLHMEKLKENEYDQTVQKYYSSLKKRTS